MAGYPFTLSYKTTAAIIAFRGPSFHSLAPFQRPCGCSMMKKNETPFDRFDSRLRKCCHATFLFPPSSYISPAYRGWIKAALVAGEHSEETLSN